jgi:hypothetical protein
MPLRREALKLSSVSSRLYSSNDIANKALSHLSDRLCENKSSVIAVGIASADNVADCPSRNEKVDAKRLNSTFAVLREFIAGRFARGATKDGPTAGADNVVRHREADPVDDERVEAGLLDYFDATEETDATGSAALEED